MKIIKLILSKSVFLLTLIVLIFFVDYLDIGLRPGYGFFSRQVKTNYLEAIVTLLLVLTLLETAKASKESAKQTKIILRQTKASLRQTEISLRPYIRFSWSTDQEGENRRKQGITDTCIIVSNGGNGLMRSVSYKVFVNGKKVPVRSHTIIESKSSTNMVYDDKNNKAGELLGCRNDLGWDKANNRIIRENKIEIKGQYRNFEGGRYSFHFETSPQEQSWFSEKYRQKLRN